jgi:hypothetical protein
LPASVLDRPPREEAALRWRAEVLRRAQLVAEAQGTCVLGVGARRRPDVLSVGADWLLD